MAETTSSCAGGAARSEHQGKPMREAAAVVAVRPVATGKATASAQASTHASVQASANFEVLLVRRRGTMAFMANAFVFPGGARDAADASLAHAAARELYEEAGVMVEPGALLPFSHWITPSVEPKRFSAHFFVAPLHDPAATVVLDEAEVTEAQWVSPATALAQREALLLPPPQQFTLLQLARAGALASLLKTPNALPADVAWPTPAILPRFGQTDAGAAIFLPWDLQYETAGQGDAAPWPAQAAGAMRDDGWPSRFVQNEHGYFAMAL